MAEGKTTPESTNETPSGELPPPPSTGEKEKPHKKGRQRKVADKHAEKAPTQPTSPPDPAAGVPVPGPPGPPQPYPPPHHALYPSYYMNPPYPGHPYQHPSYAHHPNAPPPNSSHPSPGPHPPPPPSYAYPIPPSPHHPGYYHPSYQYPPPMVMYGAPPPHPGAAVHPSSEGSPSSPQAASTGPAASSATTTTNVATTGQKRKRKAIKDEKKDDDDKSASPGGPSTSANQSLDLKKRTKTQRACDSCRTRKIRCDVLPESDPPICQHCKQYNFECSFFLPITETRFKKKYRLDAESAEREKTSETGKHASSSTAGSDPRQREAGVFGPTSTAHLLHSQATISSRHYEGYDARHNHTFQVSNNGDGIIQVHKTEQPQKPLKQIDFRVDHDMLQQLVNTYFSEVSPLLPVITKAEFLNYSNPPSILLYSMCLVTAARREVPQNVFDSIRHTTDVILKNEDVLSTASVINVQALLILCMTGDCHSQFVPSALSSLWIRLGAAIRMAQDLGLHRCESLKQPDMDLRRRLWGLCLISDRWISFTYGHPYMISLEDCDARLPSSGNQADNYIDELMRLSILLGRVQKALYTPSGIKGTTNETLEAIHRDLLTWRARLPPDLQFHGPTTPKLAGLLNLLYVCVLKMFFRLFMRISYSLPPHITFGLTVEMWSSLVADGEKAIDWLDANERVYDVWLVVAYAAVSCGLIQYHTYVRRKSSEAETKLQKLRDCVGRWEKSISPDHMSTRRKTAEIISLLYEALHTPMSLEKPALNPAGGVKSKTPMQLDYQPDSARPGGGVFVARGVSEVDLKDLHGTVIREEGGSDADGDDDEEAEGKTSSPFVRHVYDPALVSTQLGPSGTAMVNFTPLGAGNANLNPAMNGGDSRPNNQVINVLDNQQTSLQDFALADSGYLEGLPNGMFEWDQWDTFFSKFPNPGQVGQNQQ